jgi:hypothetical protein
MRISFWQNLVPEKERFAVKGRRFSVEQRPRWECPVAKLLLPAI